MLVKCKIFISGKEKEIQKSLHFLPSKGDFVKLEGKEYLVQTVVYDLTEGDFSTEIYVQEL